MFNPNVNLFDWMAMLLPFVDQAPLYNQLDFNLGYNVLPNQPGIKAQVPAFQCPTQPGLPKWATCCSGIPGPDDAGATSYSAITTHLTSAEGGHSAGADTQNGSGVIFTLSRTQFRDVLDGTSNTAAVSESYYDNDQAWKTFLASLGTVYCPGGQCYIGEFWAFGNMITTAYGINRPTTFQDPGVFSFHEGGAHFGFADGHVQFLSENIDQNLLESLTTRAGGEVLGEF
jgi:prepilin-type processing-associated H-X9-DG protein